MGWNKIKVISLRLSFGFCRPERSIPYLAFFFLTYTNSLIATIRIIRPDVVNDLPQEGQSIPNEMPPHFLDKHIPHIEGIGEPTTATFFTRSKIDPTNWYSPASLQPFTISHRLFLCAHLIRWMLEKYDGVRAFWNPQTKCFYSRNGLKVKNMGKDVIDSMPNIFLDGELWYLSSPPLSPSTAQKQQTGLEETTFKKH